VIATPTRKNRPIGLTNGRRRTGARPLAKEVAMSGRPVAERLYIASGTATLNRLIGEGELPERAEALLVAWERQAASEGVDRYGDFWQAGYRWILAECIGPPSPSH
jgi:hypothetical protein